MDERGELLEKLASLTDSQYEWFMAAALPVLRELALRELLHQEDSG